MTVLIFYISSLIFYFVDVLIKYSSINSFTWGYLYKRSIYTSLFSLFALAYFAGSLSVPSFNVLIEIIGSSFLCCLGLFFFVKSIQDFKFSNVIILSVVGNLIQQLMASFFLSEKNSISFWVSFFVMMIGVALQAAVQSTRKGLVWILLSALFWPMGYSLMSIPLKKTNVLWSITIMEIIILTISLFVLIMTRRREEIKIIRGKNNRTMILIAVMTIVGSIFLNSSYQKIKLSDLGIYQLSVLPLTYLLSLKIFREKPSIIDICSFVFIFSGFAIFIFQLFN